jgi:RimJ/RimL family protein N-acetyltransferase
MLNIRIGNEEDASRYVDYLDKVSRESDYLTFGEGEVSVEVDKQREIIRQFRESDNQLFLIAECNGEIVGNLTFRGGIRPRTKHVGEFGISVRKEYWGLGIGKKLIQYLLEWAKESGVIRKINLKVRCDNETAINLYKKFGFKEEGLLTREFLIDNQFFDALMMGLCIDY